VNHIGTLNESSMHEDLKHLYQTDEFTPEVIFEGYHIDLYSDSRLIEIQTQNFGAMKEKLKKLLLLRSVLLVSPLIIEKIITVMDKKGKKIVHTRRSPKRGKLLDIVDEAIFIPQLLSHPNLTLEVVPIDVLEIRKDDGKGSWRRKGVSIKDRTVSKVYATRYQFNAPADYLALLPKQVDNDFSSRSLRVDFDVPARQVNKLLYVLLHVGAITHLRNEGNLKIYRKSLISH